MEPEPIGTDQSKNLELHSEAHSASINNQTQGDYADMSEDSASEISARNEQDLAQPEIGIVTEDQADVDSESLDAEPNKQKLAAKGNEKPKFDALDARFLPLNLPIPEEESRPMKRARHDSESVSFSALNKKTDKDSFRKLAIANLAQETEKKIAKLVEAIVPVGEIIELPPEGIVHLKELMEPSNSADLCSFIDSYLVGKCVCPESGCNEKLVKIPGKKNKEIGKAALMKCKSHKSGWIEILPQLSDEAKIIIIKSLGIKACVEGLSVIKKVTNEVADELMPKNVWKGILNQTKVMQEQPQRNVPKNLLELMTVVSSAKEEDHLSVPVALLRKILEMVDNGPRDTKVVAQEKQKETYAEILKKNAPKINNAQNSTAQSAPTGQSKLKLKPIDKTQAISGLSIKQLVERVSTTAKKERFSPLCTRHFSGITRRPIKEIRTLMDRVGVNNSLIKNITFIGESLMEVITFENYAMDLTNILREARKLENCEKLVIDPVKFDPLSRDNIKRVGFEKPPFDILRDRLKKVLENLQERVKTQASLRRTVRFVELCIQTGSLNPSVDAQVSNMQTELPDSLLRC
jgi:hypothetical protein